jgi:hypothetical protein
MKKLFLLLVSAAMLTLVNAGAVSKQAESQKATAKINVNGLLAESDWSTAVHYSIDSLFKGEAIAGGATDCSGYFQTLWCDSGIFVAVTVTDDTKSAKGGKGPDWNQDMVEVYFSTNALMLNGGKGSKDGGGRYQVAGNAPFGADTTVKGKDGSITVYHYTGTASNYVKQQYTPWAALKDGDGNVYKPNANLPIGFDIYIVDNDKDRADSVKGYRNRKVWSNQGLVNEDYANMDDAGLLYFPAGSKDTIVPAATSKKETKAVVIDGKLDEADWAAAAKYPVTLAFKGEKIAGGASDCSGYFQTLWADSGVFVAVTVNDDVKAAKSGKGPAWNQDLVEVYFDMNVTGLKDGKGPAAANSGHYQQALAAPVGADTTVGKEAYHYTGTAANYIKEQFVPWSALKDANGNAYVPNSKISLGFDVCIVDNDKDAADTLALGSTTVKGRNYRNRLLWSNYGKVNEDYSNMNDAGKLTFADAPSKFDTKAVKTTAAVKVDGILDDADWKTAKKVEIKQNFNGESTSGLPDCSAYFQTLWSDSGMFVAVSVNDDVKGVTKGSERYGPAWNQDLVEIYFDMNVGNLKDGKGAKDAKGHYQESNANPAGADTTIKSSGTIIAIHYTGTAANYNKEVFFPWKNIADSAGKTFTDTSKTVGFDIYVVDNDKDKADSIGKKYRNRIVWSNIGTVNEDYSNLNDAGSLKITGVPVIPVPPVVNVAAVKTSSSFEIYPNPASNYITLKTSNTAALPISISNISGQIVLSSTISNNQQLNISSLENGIYFVRVTNNNQIVTSKLIKR